MSLSTFKPLACLIAPVAGENGSLSKLSNVGMMNRQAQPSLQVKTMEKSVLRESSSGMSRREMLHLTAATVGLSLLLPASAEAAPRNATMRQKIMKKFEELREKAGLSKPKDEGEEKKPNNEKKGHSKVHTDTKGANPKPKDGGEAKEKVHNGAKESKSEPKDEKKHTSSVEESKVAPSGGGLIPALPGILNGKAIETTLP